MPGMSGLELLPKAKALRPDVPVIMITQRCKVDGLGEKRLSAFSSALRFVSAS
jgi:DNA-binding NtrC family response regulator